MSAKLIRSNPLIGAFLAMIVLNLNGFSQSEASPVMSLVVDESQAPRKLAFVHEQIKVRPGPLDLAYPKWIPGEHGPTGPIQQFAALRIHSGNNVLPWTRDPQEINSIHVNIPQGTTVIDVDFDTLIVNTISDHQTAASGTFPGNTSHGRPARQSPGRSTRSRKRHSLRSISSWLTL